MGLHMNGHITGENFLCIHVDIHPQDMFREQDYTDY
jgi:hypothetical protein